MYLIAELNGTNYFLQIVFNAQKKIGPKSVSRQKYEFINEFTYGSARWYFFRKKNMQAADIHFTVDKIKIDGINKFKKIIWRVVISLEMESNRVLLLQNKLLRNLNLIPVCLMSILIMEESKIRKFYKEHPVPMRENFPSFNDQIIQSKSIHWNNFLTFLEIGLIIRILL